MQLLAEDQSARRFFKEAEGRITSLKSMIAQNERAAAYKVPQK
jgi:hypothetical protein